MVRKASRLVATKVGNGESGEAERDGLDEGSFVDDTGDRWYSDEYGDKSYMWEYH